MPFDNYQRKINYLRISVTDRCNLRCRYCMPEEDIKILGHDELLTFEEIVRVIEVFAKHGINKVRLSGGEPLVRKGIVDLVAKISHIQGVNDLSLTTNGVLLSEYAKDLAAAGLRRINISLDTLRADRFAYIARRDKFKEVWQGIEAAMKARLTPIKINVVVIKGFNDDEVKDFASLTHIYPLHIRFIELMPFGESKMGHEDKVIPSYQIREEIREIGELIPVPQHPNDGLAKRYSLKGAKGEIGFISTVTGHLCAQCNRLRITPDGMIRSCLFSENELDLKRALRNGGGDEVITQLLYEALKTKPPMNKNVNTRLKKCQRGMYAIGG